MLNRQRVTVIMRLCLYIVEFFGITLGILKPPGYLKKFK
nr:MAG TPA: hypothetical protein [Caudoviricetes sp.]